MPQNKPRLPDKLTDSERKKIKQANKAKQNPELAAAKKLKNEAKVARRKEAGTVKTFT